MYDQASRLRLLAEKNAKCKIGVKATVDFPFSSAINNRFEGRTIAITSGKGGVGKTNTAINLALAIALQNRKVGIIDADLGLANIDVLLRLKAKYNIEHVISGKKKLYEIFIKGPAGLTIMPAGSGKVSLANLSDANRNALIKELSRITGEFDIVFIDTSAGISSNVIDFILSAQEVIIITTPEPTAITDAYATLKVLSSLDNRYSLNNATSQSSLFNSIGIIVNMVNDSQQALDIADRIIIAAEKFINTRVFLLGYIIKDFAVSEAILCRQPLIFKYPQSGASQCIRTIAEKILAN
ncbi:MinD/ParA family protein [Candidatus Gottesmanbacteria bacterium]|nr:MinD/ParA family protein [Candidatus Gottesmanbacteria bacterium]